MNIKQHIALEGKYSFEVINSKTNEKRDISNIIAKDHTNIVVDSGLNALGNGRVGYGCVVGVGNSTPVASQTTLDSQVGMTTSRQSFTYGRSADAPYYLWARIKFRFGQGVAAGNLSEVGTLANSSNVLFSRALIVDTNNNPTTLTVLEDEWLDVTYELRFYQDLTDKTLSIVLDGVTHEAVVRPANITTIPSLNDYDNGDGILQHILYGYTSQASHTNGTIGTIFSSPNGSYSSVSDSYSTYINNSLERDFILTSGLNSNNLSDGISATILRTSKGDWQISYSPPIAKDSFKLLVLNFTFVWGRHE